jgi:hypothetical protein
MNVYYTIDWRPKMKAHHSLTLIALLLAGCSNNPAPLVTDTTHKGLEIRLLSDELRKQLGVGPDDLVSSVTSDGKTILYAAPGREFKFVEQEPPSDLKTINRITILVTPKASTECKYYGDGFGNKVWYPKPPCPK